MDSAPGNRSKWLDCLLSTDAVDPARAEAAFGDLYMACGFAAPRHFFWFASPFHAAWAVAMLTAPHNPLWRKMMDCALHLRQESDVMQRIRGEMCDAAEQENWDALAAEAGVPLNP